MVMGHFFYFGFTSFVNWNISMLAVRDKEERKSSMLAERVYTRE